MCWELGSTIEYNVKQILEVIFYECNGEGWLKEVFHD